MPPKNRSSLTLEQRIEVIRKSEKDRVSERKIEHFVLFFFFFFFLFFFLGGGGIVINKRNHMVTTVNNGIYSVICQGLVEYLNTSI